MTSAQVVETSVTNNSSFQNYTHPDDHTIWTRDTWGRQGLHNSKKANDQKRNHKPPENSRHKRRVNRTIEEGDADHSTSSNDEFFCKAVRHLKQVKKKIKTDGEERTVLVKIECKSWSGAEVNIMGEHQFKALAIQSSVKITLQPSRVKLSTLQSELPWKENLQPL